MFEIYEFEGETFEVSPDQLSKFLEKYPDAVKTEQPAEVELYQGDNGETFEVSIDQLDVFKEKYPNATKVGEPGKTTDSSTETQTMESNVMDSGSVDFSSELPQVTMKDVDQREAKAVELFSKKFGGLGFSFEQAGFGTDRVIITAPDKADGTPGAKQEFQTDLDVLGFSTYSDNLFGTSSKTEAKAINDFIKANTNSEVVNEETYNQTWNYANERKISAKNEDGKTKKLSELTSEELQLEIDDTYVELMYGSKRLPGADRIFKEINTNLSAYAEKTAIAIGGKYDTSKKDQYDLAVKEFNALVETEHDRLFKNSKELDNVSVAITKALDSRFGGTVSDKKRDEAEIAQLPSWVTAFDSDIIRQGYITAKIKFPKAWKEINILEHGKEMGLISNELKELNAIIAKGGSAEDKYSRDQEFTLMPSLAKDIEVGTSSITSKFDGKEIETGKKGIYDSYDGTVGDRIEYLQKLNAEYNKNLALNIASQQSYQKKLENVRVPSAFGKTIDDPDLTFDEWQGMLGDQAVQMVSAALSFGGSTYIQEGGGAALEIIEIEAAMKEFPVGFQQKMIDEFFGVEESEGKGLDLDSPPVPPSSEEWEKMTDKEKQDWKDGVVKPKTADFEQALKAFKNLSEEKRRGLMLEVLENGEANLDAAVAVGAINAGLDMVSNVVGIGKAMKFAPKSLVRDILAKNVGKILKGTKGLGVASLVEAGTEIGQEFTSMQGVGISTGYYGNKDKNLKRYGEAAAQAFLSTGPLVGGTATIGTINSEIKANYRAMKDPNDTRNAINNAKKGFDNAYQDGEISLDERNEFFDSLEAEEDIINKYTEYKEMDVDQKEAVVNENITIKGNNQRITELQAKVKKSKKESEGGISLDAIKDQIKIEDLQNENRQAQNAINKQVRISNDIKSRKRFVQHVKSNPELYNGANPMDLMTIEKAKKYFAEISTPKKNWLKDEGVIRLLAGEVNAFQVGKNVFSIQEVRHNNIKSNKGYGTSNAFHHDILHVIQEGMSIKELRAMQKEIVKQLMTSKDPKLVEIMAVADATFTERYGSKFNKTQKNYYLEYMANLSDAMKEYTLDNLTQESGMSLGRIAEYLSGTFHSKTKIGKDWANFGPENALEHIKEYTNFYGQRQSLRIPALKGKVQVDLPKDKVVKEETRYSELTKKSPEQLVKIIQRGGNPKKVKEAEDALAPQFELLALSEKALNYDTRKGDIAREDVVAEAMTYLPGIVKRYNKKDGAFSTFVIANMKPKQQVIYEKVKPLTYGETTSTDTKEARQIEDTSSETTNTEDTFVQKINILQDFAIANRVADKIKALVKVVKGDNFKSIISKYAGKVGELIFEIPAKKIMEGGANLAAVTKYTEGMPAPAEAQNIQRFFNAPNNADKFIKTLPLYNVTDKTADINKVGENLDVSRDTYGYAIGLKGLPLDYFYENYTDPKGEITSPKGRSKGLTSQTQVKRLKPEFRKPTPETVEQFKKDLGITPKNEANVYSRDIGQLLKGVAKVHSINAAISGAQRFQEAKTKAAPVTEQKAIKQQTADITAAQSKAAFSETTLDSVSELFTQGVANPNFNLDLAGANKLNTLLVKNKLDKTLNLKQDIRTIEGREKILNNFKFIMANLGPREMHFGKQGKNKFTTSGADYGVSMSKYSKTDAKKNKIPKGKKVGDFKDLEGRNALLELRKSINDLGKKNSGFTFGPPIEGVTDYSVSSYSTLLGDPEKTRFKNKEITEFNEKVSLIHEAMWDRINNLILDDKKNAAKIGTYLKLVANHTGHWHKMGAQIAGWSKKPKGVTNSKGITTLYEYEHAMPATAAYLYLMHTILDAKADFKPAYKAVMANYKLIALDKAENAKLGLAKLGRNMPAGWRLDKNFWWQRYFNEVVEQFDNGINPNSIVGLDGKTFGEMFNIKRPITKENLSKTKTLNKAIIKARTSNYSEVSKGITVLDFDDTLATSKSMVLWTDPNGVTGKLTAEEFAKQGADLLAEGYVYDFSEFNKVVKGKKAPLFEKALKLQSKFGPENMFILTARPAESAASIFEFVKANGLNIPLKNITGLANSTAEAKALWMVDKVSEGYNDFYFADDALQNVQAVDNILEQFDVKRKVQQARVNFSETMNDQFNDILENVTGIESDKRFSIIKGRKRGESKGKFRVFIPPSHEDFVGLLYNFMGKGKEGDKHRDFFEQALVKPLNRAYREIDTAKQAVANDYKSLNKQFPDVKKKLIKNTPDGDFTFQDAIRVYLWNKHGHKTPGLSETDQRKLAELVMSDPQLQAYAETLNVISKQETYVDPGPNWETANIRIDLVDATGRVGRAGYFAEFNENAEVMFSEENLNKIEAAYGKDFREALEDMLHAIKTGINRPKGSSAAPNMFLNWLNASVSGVMFFNTRSSILQQMSIVNYLNFADNNMYTAGKAFANQKQYWKDFAMIFNSDMLKQRRGGIGTDINGAELAEAIKKARPGNLFDQVAIITGKALKLGFLPTQIGDNIAIAVGGAAFYRNRVNTYLKQGMSQKEAEAAAFTDFQDITQSTQQSSRPDMTSQQQRSWIGKLILNFQNITSQYNRLMKKAALDIKNKRISPPYTTRTQSNLGNLSKILYYGAVQNVVFYSLQTALFAVMFDDDEDEDQIIKKKERVIQGTIDSILRGTGIYGAVASTLKNMVIKFREQREKKYNKDESAVLMEGLNLSPVVGIRARGIVNAEKTLNYNMPVIKEMETFDIDNPMWSAVTNVIQVAGFPANRMYQKTINVRNSLDNQYTGFQRALFFSGFTTWSLGLGDTEKMKEIKEKTKSKKKKRGRGKIRTGITR